MLQASAMGQMGERVMRSYKKISRIQKLIAEMLHTRRERRAISFSVIREAKRRLLAGETVRGRTLIRKATHR